MFLLHNALLTVTYFFKIKNPSSFWGTRTAKFEDSKFRSLQDEIANYYSNEQLFKAPLSNPTEGMVWYSTIIDYLVWVNFNRF